MKKQPPIPDRGDLDASEFKALPPNILIGEVEAHRFRIRCRPIGTKVDGLTGVNMTGCSLNEVMSDVAGGYSEYGVGIVPVGEDGAAVQQFIAIADHADLVFALVQGGDRKLTDQRPIRSEMPVAAALREVASQATTTPQYGSTTICSSIAELCVVLR